ncbi:MAG: hypothetical protein HXY49_08830 [Ignavibacteriaceae bacterium]|nr:hypothetical protein [Ignavibacteriaceae bacterium]
MDDKFYSKSMNIQNPFKHYGLAKIIVSIFILFFSIQKILELKDGLLSFISADNSSRDFPFFAVVIVATIIIAFIWLIWGIKNLVAGIRDQGSLVLSPQLPPEFRSYNEVEVSLKKKFMSVYSLPKSGPLAIARKYFSDKIPYLTSTTKQIVEKNVSFTIRILNFIIFLFVVSFFSDFIKLKLSENLSVPESFLSFPILFTIFIIVAAIVNIGSIFYLLPQSSPKADVDESIYSIKGAGDPFVFNSEVEEALVKVRNKDIPNRIFKEGFDEKSGGVQDTGKFNGKIFVENHPIYVPFNIPQVVYFFLVFGFVFLIYGVYTLLNFTPSSNVINEKEILSTLDFLWTLFIGIIYSNIGLGFFAKAHLLFGTFRFESILIFLEIEGSFGRSEIRAGKAINDSFESRNTVVRSDFQVKQYVVKALTENYTIEGNRFIIGMIQDDESIQAKNILNEAIIGFRDSGVSIRGVDLSSASVSEMAKANIIYQQNARLEKSEFDKNDYDKQIEENKKKLLDNTSEKTKEE